MIALPPSSLGAVQLTSADFVSASAVAPVGAAGAPAPVGVTEFDAAEAAPDPLGFEAVTLNV